MRRASDTAEQFALGEGGPERVCGQPVNPLAAPAIVREVAERRNVDSNEDIVRAPDWLHRIPLTPVAFAALAGLVLTLWLPFGWKVTGLYEEWLFMSGGDTGDPVRLLYHPYPSEAYRPLTLAPYILGYILTPGSFLGFNIIFALWALGKGAAMYALVRRLVPDNPALAFVSSALLVVYPADHALLTLRTTNVHAGVFLFLIALNLLIVAWQRVRWSTLLAMLVAEGIALATYDGGILLSLCGPGLLLWLRPRIDKRLVTVAALWWGVSVSFLLHLILTLRDSGSYAAQLLAQSTVGKMPVVAILRSWGHSMARAYLRNFGTGWYEALRGLDWQDPYLHVSAALTVFVLIPAIWLHARRGEDTTAADTKGYLVLACLGVIAVAPGFAMYLPTEWRNSSWRVFLYSSIGAALAVGVACFLFARLFGQWQRLVFVGLTSALILSATVHALIQHRGYFEYSQRQQQILADIISEAPRLKPETTVLLIDRTPTAAFKAWSMCTVVSNCLEWALRYIYDDHTLRAMYCAPGYRPRNQFSEECHFERDRVSVPYVHWGLNREMHPSSPYASLVVFENSARGLNVLRDISGYQPEAGANGYQPDRRIDASSPVPPRAHTLFARWPFKWTEPRADDDSGPVPCRPLC
jgi:hypothetical protein